MGDSLHARPQAKNNTDYLLLASDDASIFVGNSVVTKTSIPSVSPGESFETFFGVDPAVKVRTKSAYSSSTTPHYTIERTKQRETRAHAINVVWSDDAINGRCFKLPLLFLVWVHVDLITPLNDRSVACDQGRDVVCQ